MNLGQKVNQLFELIKKCENIEAIEKFYGENVIRQENNEKPKVGKALYITEERANINKVSEFTQTPISVLIDEEKGIVMSEWTIKFTYKNATTRKVLNEVSVQHWKDGQIVYERFYHNGFEDEDTDCL